jgi:lysozyme
VTAHVTGIDVSPYQPRIDWRAVAGAGHAFAYCKATEGNGWVSSRYRDQRAGARLAGLVTGAYHFARWETAGDPAADARDEAAHFFDVVGALEPGDLPPALDLEWITGQKRPALQLVVWARAFVEEVERLFGAWPIIYTGPSFWRYCLLPAGRPALDLTSWPLWVADYTPTGGKPDPMKDAASWKWTFWQFTGHGRCPGITDAHGALVDCDINRFNGTLAELRVLAGLGDMEARA